MGNKVKKCPKCGYERQITDIVADYECPACGIVYNKYESALIRENLKINKDNQSNKIFKENKKESFISLFKAAPLWQRLFLSFVFIFGSIGLLLGTDSSEGKIKYTVNENYNGVKFYYFSYKHAPELEPKENFTDLNDTHLNKILSSIPRLPTLPHDGFRKGGKYLFIKDLEQGRKISILLKECRKYFFLNYFCIEQLTYSPSPREMAIMKAKHSPKDFTFVSEKDYGDKWPFTFEYGVLDCRRYRDIVIFNNDGTYALNGKAISSKKYKDSRSVRKNLKGGGKFLITSSLIQKGINLCK